MNKHRYDELCTVSEVPSLDVLSDIGSAALASLRTEHSRSLECAQQMRAIQSMIDLGVLTRLSDMDMYHGRAAKLDEQWSINPEFANGGNDSGNNNINARPTLYAASQDIAYRFAERRSRSQPSSRPEVHCIISRDTDAVVLKIVDNFDASSGERFRDAMVVLMPEIIDDAEFPLGTSQNDIAVARQELRNVLDRVSGPKFITDRECEGMSDLAKQFAARYNTWCFAIDSPHWLGRVVNEYLGKGHTIKTEDRLAYPIDHLFITQLMRNSHIVGSERAIYSATLDENMRTVSFFDLYNIETTFNIRNEREKINDVFGEFSQTVGSQLNNIQEPLRSVIMNPYAAPKAIMEATGSVSDGLWSLIFSGDTGNWEGYTLGEHTETVLRNLENNFADELPVGALAFARLALIVHDIGKSAAVRAGRKDMQPIYNAEFAGKFLQEIGADENIKDFIVGMVTDGMNLAGRHIVRKEPSAREKLLRYADQQLVEAFVDMHNGIRAYQYMTYILQTCDSGAYTGKARTRRAIGREGGDVLLKNAAAFDESFKELSNDMTGQRLEWKKL